MLTACAAGVLVAAAGFVVEGRMPIETEPERWVSPTGTAVQELHDLRKATGLSTQLGVMIEADDVTSEAAVAWMYRFQTAEQKRHSGQLLQAASIPGVAADVVGITPTGNDVRALLPLAPHDISASFVSADHKTANLVFPIGDMSLSERSDLIASTERDLRGDLAPLPAPSSRFCSKLGTRKNAAADARRQWRAHGFLGSAEPSWLRDSRWSAGSPSWQRRP